MVSFRKAVQTDYENIARLHATSWQQNYRGTFSDHFLDVTVLPERLAVWKTRCAYPSENQCILLAEEEGLLLGFCCAYINQSPQYGTYLDNLHVSDKAKGKGLGTLLILNLSKEIKARNGVHSMYLWVLENNKGAIDFYNKLNGRGGIPVQSNGIGDRPFWQIRYVWDNLDALEETINTKIAQYEHRRI